MPHLAILKNLNVLRLIEIGFYTSWIGLSRVFTGKYPPGAINGLVGVLIGDFHFYGKRSIALNYAPNLDPKSQATVTQSMRKRTAKVAFRATTFYHKRLKEAEINLNNMDDDNFRRIPATTAAEFRGKEESFVNQELKNHSIFYTSTGTTSYPPSGIWVTRYEMDLFAAMGTFSYLAQGIIYPDDIVQISFTSRAGLTNWILIEACRRIGAACYVSGLIDPKDGLLDLSKKRKTPGKKEKASVLLSYPSYVDSLVRVAKEAGYSGRDFGLERIVLVGEILTPSARNRMMDFFECEIREVYNCSELIPVTGMVCPEGNLHLGGDGEIEVVDPESFEQVSVGEEGLLCVTPFYPLRQGTLLLRYTPGDVVKRINGCACNLGGPVTSNICGKFDPLLMRHGINRRKLAEVLEDIPGVFVPLHFTLMNDDAKSVLHLRVSSKNDDVSETAYSRLEKLGVKDVDIVLHLPDERFHHYPTRNEMLENTFHSLRAEGAL